MSDSAQPGSGLHQRLPSTVDGTGCPGGGGGDDDEDAEGAPSGRAPTPPPLNRGT